MPENFENKFDRREAGRDEVERYETLEQLGIEPGDQITLPSGSFRVAGIVFNRRDAGGGYAELESPSDRPLSTVTLSELKQSVVDVRGFDDSDQDYFYDRHEQRRLVARKVWQQFAEQDIGIGDTIYSRSGTRRLIKEVAFEVYADTGGELRTVRRTPDGDVGRSNLPLTYVTENNAWIQDIVKQRGRS